MIWTNTFNEASFQEKLLLRRSLIKYLFMTWSTVYIRNTEKTNENVFYVHLKYIICCSSRSDWVFLYLLQFFPKKNVFFHRRQYTIHSFCWKARLITQCYSLLFTLFRCIVVYWNERVVIRTNEVTRAILNSFIQKLHNHKKRKTLTSEQK